MSWDQNLPVPPYDAGGTKEAKDYAGPKWVPAARVGDKVRFGGDTWTITQKANHGRVIHWRCEDGRVARTECMPTHPHYPKDPTRAEELAAHRALKEKKRRFFETFGYWPSDTQV